MFYAWTYESTRSEKPRSRFYFATRSKYPTNRLWVEDLVRDAARTVKIHRDFKSNEFFLFLYQAKSQSRYGKGIPVAVFKVKLSKRVEVQGDLVLNRLDEVEIKSATFIGQDSKLANYEWQYGIQDPLHFPRRPLLAPKTPDVLSKGSMFAGAGGTAHHQYPRVSHVSHLDLEKPYPQQYPHLSNRWYGHIEARRSGRPTALPAFSSHSRSRRQMASKGAQERPTY